MTGRSSELSRRLLLRSALLAVPLVAACGPGYADAPDPLVPLLEQAKADAAAAQALAEEDEAAKEVATAREAHARALQSEVDRLNRPKSAVTPVSAPDGMAGLKQRLATARSQAAQLLPTESRFRAGILASIIADCAALQKLKPAALGPGDDAAPLTVVEASKDTVDALQQALAAEHAAIWVYGLVSAFLPADFSKAVAEGAADHVKRRDFCERTLTAAGATPRGPEAAYVPPKPVTDQTSAMAVVASAEGDVAGAWRSVVEHSDGAMRDTATQALISASRRGTPWRAQSGLKPAALLVS
ncbi:ferritin-like domain-containing protein [Amycolatopsis sp. NPDC059657]|uniref:ferritin-like domain-containing protein n=1 Tax=Amycolatopsis sp. NPDC059657 TaxID=3346899 RepID=UPI00366BFC5E